MNTPSAATETLQGTIERCLFHNQENGFAVLIIATSNQNKITATGTFSTVILGQELQITGSWLLHKKFGKQFEISTYHALLPTTVTGLKKYLGSGLIKGVGKSYADKLVDHFGTEILTVIDKTPDRLREVAGIGPKRIETIMTAWRDQREIAQVMVFLQEKGVSPSYAVKIYKQYRQDALRIITENPYRLADEVWGIGFKTADQIAQHMGIHPHAPARLQAALLHTLAQSTKQGHLYTAKETVYTQIATLLTLKPEEHELIGQSIQSLVQSQKIIVLNMPAPFITLSSYYRTEQYVAQRLRMLMQVPSPFSFKTEAVEKFFLDTHPITLNKEQQAGIISSLHNKCTIITGGPGTGKTTLIKQLITILEANKIRFKLAAPTGRAAQRIAEGSFKSATTIHRLLEFDMALKTFKHDEQHPLGLDFLIIDEASMIDIFLAQSLIKAVPVHAHIIFLGDVDQLPSVGAGNFLNDCIASGVIPVTRLTELFRQAHDSLITSNAHRINRGEFPYKSKNNDFIFIQEEDPAQLPIHLKRLLFAQLPAWSLQLQDVALLCPMNRGAAGTQTLNTVMQELCNPGKSEHMINAGVHYKINDKVMQIRNNYDKLVFNGDIGILTAIDRENQIFEVTFDSRIIPYEFDEINELVLAYAITIHKSQGSEYPAVIIPLFTEHFPLLQRNLIYTAITRAKKHCIFIGQIKALAIAIKNNKGINRITYLRTLLHEL